MNSSKHKRRFFKAGDLGVIFVLLVLSLVLNHVQSLKGGEHKISAYCIKVLSSPQKEIMLFEPQKKPLTIKGLKGSSVIEWNNEGKIRFASSACPNKACVNMGWCSEGSIICVPNGVVINIIADKNQFDAVSK